MIHPPTHSETRRSASTRGGFSLTEVLVVIVILTILVTMMVAFLRHTRTQSRSVNCMTQLRGLWAGFRQYAVDHSHLLPDPGASDQTWEHSLSIYIPVRKAFHCPADDEVFSSTGSSYDWRDTGDELTTLAGRRFTDAQRLSVVLVFDALPGWHGPETMNVITADGVGQSMPYRLCLTDLLTPIQFEKHGKPADLPAPAVK